MKTSAFSLAVALFCGAFLWLTNCQQQPSEKPAAETAQPKEDPVKRGEYLSTILACDDCHTPKKMTEKGPVPDMERRFMGHPADEPFEPDDAKRKLINEQHVVIFNSSLTAAAGPWGISYAANITPDDTGIGAWTEAQFIKAIREGKSKGMDGTRPLLPPMPWPGYAKMTDDDLKALFAYIKTMKPIKNVVSQPKTL